MSSWVSIQEESAMKADILKKANELTVGLLDKMRQEFRSNGKNIIAMNAVCSSPMANVLVNRDLATENYHVYSDRLEIEGKVTNQKSSGRCWLFAALNVLRLDLIKKYKLDDSFELSQTHLFFYDKLEKSNWFLENVLNTLEEDVDGRLFQFLLAAPVQDGGQWDMAVNLIEKYGLVPKTLYSECAHSGNSRQFNWLLTSKLREFSCKLRKMAGEGLQPSKLQEEKNEMIKEIYRILAITLGEPPKQFDWCFRDKDKKFVSFKNLTPHSFLKEHVGINKVADQVSLIHDPRHEYNSLLSVAFLGNVVGGHSIRYINLEIGELKKFAIAAIQGGSAVWFGCDVGKFSNRKLGIMDLDIYDYENTFSCNFTLDKADRLRFGESLMTHAMALTAVHIEEGKPVRWRVENSWGEDGGEKGYFSMSDAWFEQYVYQVVVDRALLPSNIVSVLEKEPVTLPPWDPLGALA